MIRSSRASGFVSDIRVVLGVALLANVGPEPGYPPTSRWATGLPPIAFVVSGDAFRLVFVGLVRDDPPFVDAGRFHAWWERVRASAGLCDP